MIDTRENAQAFVDILRSMYQTDPAATKALFAHRVPCNRALAEHPTIIVRGKEEPRFPFEGTNRGDWDVGFLGIVNALFGPAHRVAVLADDVTGELAEEGFRLVDVSK